MFLDEPTSGLDSYTSHEVCVSSMPSYHALICPVYNTQQY